MLQPTALLSMTNDFGSAALFSCGVLADFDGVWHTDRVSWVKSQWICRQSDTHLISSWLCISPMLGSPAGSSQIQQCSGYDCDCCS